MGHSDERDEGAAANKPPPRHRVSQACEPCRLKKGKCDGRHPTCNVCRRHGIDCSYDPKPRKRGLRPGQYSTLERRAFLSELVAAVLMSRTPNAEEQLHAFFSFEAADLPFLAAGNRQGELDELLNQWKKGPIAQWLLQTSARADPVLDHMSRIRSTQLSGIDIPNISSSEEQAIPPRDNGEHRACTDRSKAETNTYHWL